MRTSMKRGSYVHKTNEYHPFDRKSLSRYLRNSIDNWKYLTGRIEEMNEELSKLTEGKNVDGETFEDRIRMVTFQSQNNDSEISNPNRYNPDTLHNQWEKIMKPYESQRMLYVNAIRNLMYDLWRLNCVNRCIDQLLPEERSLIIEVYIQGEKVRSYCKKKQIGHGSYNTIKETALDHLLFSCNVELENLYINWRKMYEKDSVDNDDTMPGNWDHQHLVNK